MLGTILIIAGAVVLLAAIVVVVRHVHAIDDELDYPEAHGPGPTPEGRGVLQIGIGLSSQNNGPFS